MNFRCDLCQIMVPDQDTLDKHMRGKDHLKRVKQQHLQFVPRAGEFPDAELQYINDSEVVDGACGYRTGPGELLKRFVEVHL